MADTEELNEPEPSEQGERCQVIVWIGDKRCGRRIYQAPPGVDDRRVCLMHSKDPNKDDAAFQAEFERILEVAAERLADVKRRRHPDATWAEFRQYIHVSGEGVANFSGFVFLSSRYYGREFRVPCDFDDATFSRDADFEHTHFLEFPSFTGAKFAQAALFNYARFPEGASFAWATFKGKVEFKGSNFPDERDAGGLPSYTRGLKNQNR